MSFEILKHFWKKDWRRDVTKPITRFEGCWELGDVAGESWLCVVVDRQQKTVKTRFRLFKTVIALDDSRKTESLNSAFFKFLNF